MIRDLFRILGPQNQGRYREFLVWAVLYGVMQGFGSGASGPGGAGTVRSELGQFRSVARRHGPYAL